MSNEPLTTRQSEVGMKEHELGPLGRYKTVGGMQTHYLEAGDGGKPLLLLHSGEFGGCAESSWGVVLNSLASQGFHVVAPDWLGFGRSDKVIDFADPKGRRIQHMAEFISDLGWNEPAIVGNSMGGTYLAQELASNNPRFSASAAVIVSGGGFVPDNDARRAIQDYDLSLEGMRRIIRTLMHSPAWASDENYVRWRHELSLIPGAWQCAESARLRPPSSAPPKSDFGRVDTTAYERIGCPTLLIAGADDPLREPGYAQPIADRIADCQVLTYEACGHMPNVEHAERFTQDVTSFLLP
ncbi:alpha/beta fold hydrolase [Arthrobacter sp. RHLT1-20]